MYPVEYLHYFLNLILWNVKKCHYDVLDLLDESENKMEDMIDILNSIHHLVPDPPFR